MAKLCNHCGKWPVFAAGFCKYHQYKRKMRGGDKYESKPRPKSLIPKESKIRKKERIRYLDQIKMFWDESVANGTDFCFFCGIKMLKRDNIHHLQGRTGDYYLDKEWFVNAHNDCHVFKYHYMPMVQLMQQPWYSSFLARLKSKSEILYYKELKRQAKAELF